MRPRLLPLALTALALPTLVGAGKCGIIYDTSSLQLVLEPVSVVDVESNGGGLEVFAFDRNGIIVSFYLYGYDASLDDVGHAVVDDTLDVFMRKAGPAEVTADFYLEVPLGTELILAVDDGPVKLTGVDAPISGAVLAGDVEGIRLATAEVDLEVSGAVTLELLARPVTVRVAADAGDIAITLPAGAYRCDLEADKEPVLEDITCDDAADAELVLAAPAGEIRIEGTTP
jgi:hypothetical protein